MTNETALIRTTFLKPIQQLILEIDKYTCNLCLKQKSGKLHVHHIINTN
jgi:5-methylcytosine-specific restriction endonuclease McrA